VIIRFLDPAGDTHVGWLHDDGVHPLAVPTIAAVLQLDPAERSAALRSARDVAPRWSRRDVRLCAPVDGRTEVWACGVTYERSREARMEESEQSADVYDRVYDAARPEVFLKSVAWRVVGHRGTVTVRHDSSVNVPEPELAVVVDAGGSIAGYTICNDMSSRDIEGENPLYVPQAKIWLGSCALGPGIVPADELTDPYDLAVHLEVRRAGQLVLSSSTSTARLHRRLDGLVAAVLADNPQPDGVVVSTGTGIVPDLSFTLQPGDEIEILVEGIGTLRNWVGLGAGAAVLAQPEPTDEPHPRHQRE
jgi:2-dehydro-3-deoxy-D-arabinonate dehydratase